MASRVTVAFKYADDGIRLRDIPEGAEIDGDAEVQALSRGWAVPLDEKAKPAPENKAVQAAPKNKAKG